MPLLLYHRNRQAGTPKHEDQGKCPGIRAFWHAAIAGYPVATVPGRPHFPWLSALFLVADDFVGSVRYTVAVPCPYVTPIDRNLKQIPATRSLDTKLSASGRTCFKITVRFYVPYCG